MNLFFKASSKAQFRPNISARLKPTNGVACNSACQWLVLEHKACHLILTLTLPTVKQLLTKSTGQVSYKLSAGRNDSFRWREEKIISSIFLRNRSVCMTEALKFKFTASLTTSLLTFSAAPPAFTSSLCHSLSHSPNHAVTTRTALMFFFAISSLLKMKQ